MTSTTQLSDPLFCKTNALVADVSSINGIALTTATFACSVIAQAGRTLLVGTVECSVLAVSASN